MNEEEKWYVWHNSNFGNPAFRVEVINKIEAKKILDILANYDLYLGDKIIANAQGLCNAQGEEWECDECYENIDRCKCDEKGDTNENKNE